MNFLPGWKVSELPGPNYAELAPCYTFAIGRPPYCHVPFPFLRSRSLLSHICCPFLPRASDSLVFCDFFIQ